MDKKPLIVVAALLLIAAFALGNFVSSRRAHMMGGGGSTLPLAAVSADGRQIPLAADVEMVTGKLSDGAAAQKTGDMVVIFSVNPYPATMRQPTDFSVILKDMEGKAINDAVVTLDMTMPEMWMPPNQPALEFVSDGKYQAMGQFSMRGWWRIEVIITRGGKTQSVFFDLGL